MLGTASKSKGPFAGLVLFYVKIIICFGKEKKLWREGVNNTKRINWKKYPKESKLNYGIKVGRFFL